MIFGFNFLGNVIRMTLGIERLLEETPETYYWIGFLMADGCISFNQSRNDYHLSLAISQKDKEHLPPVFHLFPRGSLPSDLDII